MTGGRLAKLRRWGLLRALHLDIVRLRIMHSLNRVRFRRIVAQAAAELAAAVLLAALLWWVL